MCRGRRMILNWWWWVYYWIFCVKYFGFWLIYCDSCWVWFFVIFINCCVVRIDWSSFRIWWIWGWNVNWIWYVFCWWWWLVVFGNFWFVFVDSDDCGVICVWVWIWGVYIIVLYFGGDFIFLVVMNRVVVYWVWFDLLCINFWCYFIGGGFVWLWFIYVMVIWIYSGFDFWG